MPAWVIPAITAAYGLVSQAIAQGKDRRQLTQQEKLQQLQIKGNKDMMDYGMGLQRQMWEDTGYGPQKQQMKDAGLNPALMYGMGGGGGQSVGSPGGAVTSGVAPSGSGHETEDLMSQGMMLASQMKLLNSQKENIDADTANKKMDTLDKAETKTGKEYDNIIKDLLTNRDKDGNLIEDEAHDKDRVGFQQVVQDLNKAVAETTFKLDENKRQELMNSTAIKKLTQEITLMKQQGKTQEEMANNLAKEGQLKDLEIAWANAGLTRESLTKFIQILLLKALN